MEMTQMKRKDDDMIELYRTPDSRCRDNTLNFIIPIYIIVISVIATIKKSMQTIALNSEAIGSCNTRFSK